MWHTTTQSTKSVRRGATQGHNCAKAIVVRWVGKANGTTNGHDYAECDDTIMQGLGLHKGNKAGAMQGWGAKAAQGCHRRAKLRGGQGRCGGMVGCCGGRTSRHIWGGVTMA